MGDKSRSLSSQESAISKHYLHDKILDVNRVTICKNENPRKYTILRRWVVSTLCEPIAESEETSI